MRVTEQVSITYLCTIFLSLYTHIHTCKSCSQSQKHMRVYVFLMPDLYRQAKFQRNIEHS